MDITATAAPLTTTASTRVATVTTDHKSTSELSSQDLQQIQQLKARDQLVRAHESAHIAAGAGIVHGGANYSFQRGPNGVQYAVGGEVKIDSSKVEGDPQATLKKAEKIRAAALAPAQPSAQDRSVAAKAVQMAIEARAEITQQQNNDTSSDRGVNSVSSSEESTGNLFDLTA
jgi:SprA family protein